MIPLTTTFRYDGHDFRQISRDGMVAVFEKSKCGRVRSYETVVIRQCKEREIAGRVIPAREAMPSDESWGVYGFTCATKDHAYAKAAELAAKAQNRPGRVAIPANRGQNAPAGYGKVTAGHLEAA